MRINTWILSLIITVAAVASVDAQGFGGGGWGGRGGGRGGGGGVFMLVRNEAVQKDLALSSEAEAKVKSLTEEFDKGLGERPDFENLSREEVGKAMEKRIELSKTQAEKLLPKLKDALSADQFVRLQQIQWQTMGVDAYSDAEIVKALPVAQDQQDKIKAINTEYAGKFDELRRGGRDENGREKMQVLFKERDSKISEVLTKEQLDKFATLKGKEFDISQLRGRGPGGGGGRGPGGGGGKGKRPQSKD